MIKEARLASGWKYRGFSIYAGYDIVLDCLTSTVNREGCCSAPASPFLPICLPACLSIMSAVSEEDVLGAMFACGAVTTLGREAHHLLVEYLIASRTPISGGVHIDRKLFRAHQSGVHVQPRDAVGAAGDMTCRKEKAGMYIRSNCIPHAHLRSKGIKSKAIASHKPENHHSSSEKCHAYVGVI